MTTIVARLLGWRASAHELLGSCAAAAPFLGILLVSGSARVWLPAAVVATITATAVRHDAEHGVIPDRLALLAISVPLGSVLVDRNWNVPIGAAVMSAPLLLCHAADPDLFGFGDVKLAAALGATLGLLEPGLGVVALVLAALVGLCQAIGSQRSSVPFGWALLVGFEVAASVGSAT